MKINFENRLEIVLSNEKPVVLTDLTLSLLAVSQQFQIFVETETTPDYQASTELYIREVRSGSIVVELVAVAMPIVPLIWEGGPLSQWVSYAQSLLNWFQGKVTAPPKEVTKTDLQQWNSILEPVAKDSGAQWNFTVSDGGKVINQVFVNSHDANAAQNMIHRELTRLEALDEHIHRKKVMVWYQTKFDIESYTGDKAIIESVTKRPLKVIFENSAVKEAMLKGDERFSKPWHQLAYVVDVEVQTVNAIPKLYKVLRYYANDTFDPT